MVTIKPILAGIDENHGIKPLLNSGVGYYYVECKLSAQSKMCPGLKLARDTVIQTRPQSTRVVGISLYVAGQNNRSLKLTLQDKANAAGVEQGPQRRKGLGSSVHLCHCFIISRILGVGSHFGLK